MTPITYVLVVISCLSLVGSSGIIYFYYRLGFRNNFALNLISLISVSDVIFSFGNLVYVYPGKNVSLLEFKTCRLEPR